MLPWLLLTCGVALGSALIPFVNVELFILGLMTQRPDTPWFAVAVVVSVAQMVGKLLFYYAARGSIPLPAMLHRKDKPMTERRARWQLRTKRLRTWVETIKEKCERHPRWMLGTYGLSAVTGMPPFMAIVVLAGLVRMRLATFLSVGLAGRFVRFALLAASPAMFAGWLA